MHKPIVLIPVYKIKISDNEVRSLKQCLNILDKHSICIVHPYSLNLSTYKNIADQLKKEITFKAFDKKYFANIQGYNKLMLSLKFYSSFSKYDYMLIYQLDAWVFRDELNLWCKKGYDYIGAPWFKGWGKASKDSPIIGIGNGGFSLRKIKSAIRCLRILKGIRFLDNQLKRFLTKEGINNKKLSNFMMLPYKILKINSEYLNHIINDHQTFEDLVWSKYISKTFSGFRIAPINEGIGFSFEVNPNLLYFKNNQKLPFGCHAWEKYEFNTFWVKHI